MREIYIQTVRDLANNALHTKAPPAVIQDAYKAVEFALCLYAFEKKKPVPKNHLEAKNLAYRLDKSLGRKFGALLDWYYGSYGLRDGKRAEAAKQSMREILEEVGRLVGEDLLLGE